MESTIEAGNKRTVPAAVTGAGGKSAGQGKLGVALWIVQVLLALLFLFAGVTKLVMPIEELVKQTSLPGPFMRFIGVVELLGGLGVFLPAVTRIRPGLTPLAASGLVIVMIGAVVVSLRAGVAMAVLPLLVGLLAAFVAYGRWRLAPIRGRTATG